MEMHSKSVHLDGGVKTTTNTDTGVFKNTRGRKKRDEEEEKESIKNKSRGGGKALNNDTSNAMEDVGVSKNMICGSGKKRGRKALKKRRVKEKESTTASVVVAEDPDCYQVDRYYHDHNKCIESVFRLYEENLSDLYELIGFTPPSPSHVAPGGLNRKAGSSKGKEKTYKTRGRGRIAGV